MSLMRPELQVLTEHRMSLPPKGMGLRHIEQTSEDVSDISAVA